MGLRIVPSDTHIPFAKFRNVAAAVSLAAIVGSIAAFFVLGLNFGIDFRGGINYEVSPAEGQAFNDSDLTTVRSALTSLNIGNINAKDIIAQNGGASHIAVTVELQEISREEGQSDEDYQRAAEQRQNEVAELVKSTLNEILGEDISYYREEVVGPTVSGELIQAGVMAMVIAVSMMLVYIWFRFEWQFALGAIVALVHDVIITIGVFCITQLDFTMSIIAALLTIIGYSMNDTVVVFDRIRENLRKYKKKPLSELIDLSINQTLARTLMTSLTTLIALVSLFLLGGEVLRGFSFALIWGIVIGTYSSIFIASPMLLRTGVKRDWSEQASGTPAPTNAT